MAQNAGKPSFNELAAFKIVEEAMGLPVVAHDDNSKPRMVDGLIHLADGTDAALEVIGDHDSLPVRLK